MSLSENRVQIPVKIVTFTFGKIALERYVSTYSSQQQGRIFFYVWLVICLGERQLWIQNRLGVVLVTSSVINLLATGTKTAIPRVVESCIPMVSTGLVCVCVCMCERDK